LIFIVHSHGSLITPNKYTGMQPIAVAAEAARTYGVGLYIGLIFIRFWDQKLWWFLAAQDAGIAV